MLKKVRIKGISFKNNKETPKFAKKHSNVGANVERSVLDVFKFFYEISAYFPNKLLLKHRLFRKKSYDKNFVTAPPISIVLLDKRVILPPMFLVITISRLDPAIIPIFYNSSPLVSISFLYQ